MRFEHEAVVRRRSTSVVAKAELASGYPVQFPKLACTCTPMGAFRKVTVLGSGAGRKMIIEWGEEELREGDRIEVLGRVWRFEYDCDDRHRSASTSLVGPYQTGILHEEAARG